MASFNQEKGLRGACPTPLFEVDKFPIAGGFTPGRLCFPVEALNTTCCLPCPLTEWIYPDHFQQRAQIGSWVNVAAAFATVFLLLSFLILPVKWTHRHYLSICLTIGVMCIQFAFILPLMSQPDQCYNQITPHDMRSDLTCAFSGAFLLFGGWAVVIWIFWRALSIHLQICWEMVPGPRFFYSALAFGWGIPAVGVATTLSVSGVSYRFGNICHINHNKGLQDFWGPLLTFAAIAMVLQFVTIGYCIHVYVRSMLNDSRGSTEEGTLPSYNGSIITTSARQTYRRVKKVILLQWRGATIVLFIIAEVAFFSVVFVSMDNNSTLNEALIEKATPWVTCLVLNSGDKNKCLDKAAVFAKPERIVLSVLICLGLSGFWCLFFLGRWSMVLGWRDLIRRKMLKKGEFVSADVQEHNSDPRTYEMLDCKRSNTPALTTRSSGIDTPTQTTFAGISPLLPDAKLRDDYFDRKASARYLDSPTSNYSSPSLQYNSGVPKDWNSLLSHASPTLHQEVGTAISKNYAAT